MTSARRALLVTTLVTAGLASPALASHKKPITETYTATAATPDPGNAVTGTLCDGVNPAATGEHLHEFAVPEAGTLEVILTNYQGDWDLAVRNSKGSMIGGSGSGGYQPVAGGDEKVKIKVKKAEKLTIVGCNWAGSPTATVKVTFTFAK
ncbi:MAG TPA: hypothetical protein VNA14_02540 [Mycobacteriales bacterium]|nr:hypothetical protein [Mycobacteriales bacterium]